VVAGHSALTAFYVFCAFILGLVGAFFFVTRRGKSRYFACAEYWMYLPGVEMPEENDIMTRVIGRNPYVHKGRQTIGTAEGLVFSDVRLHIALVLRKRNALAFRPDVFDSAAEPTAEQLQLLDNANAFVKARFVSEDVLKDARHLQFLPHLADAVSELGEGQLIFDVVAEKLMTRAELSDYLRKHAEVSGPDFHTQVVWRAGIDSGYAETRGLVKVGHKELRTPNTPSDQRILVVAVLQEAIRQIWSTPILPETLEIQAFDDRFRVVFEPGRDKFTTVRVLRLKGQ